MYVECYVSLKHASDVVIEEKKNPLNGNAGNMRARLKCSGIRQNVNT
jgi:hypothetical protein